MMDIRYGGAQTKETKDGGTWVRWTHDTVEHRHGVQTVEHRHGELKRWWSIDMVDKRWWNIRQGGLKTWWNIDMVN